MKKTINKKNSYETAMIYHINTLTTKNTYLELGFNDFPEPQKEFEHYILKEYDLKIDENKINKNPLSKIIKDRHSAFKMNNGYLTFEEISQLLYFSYGYLDEEKSRRPVPSGGARYPVYFYIAIFNVESIEKGIYYYNATENKLQLIFEGDFRTELLKNILEPNSVKECSAIIMNVCSIRDTCSKYGNMGYKLMCVDLGHVSQNIYLLSSALNIECRAHMGFFNDYFDNLLNLNTQDESTLLLHVLGKGFDSI
ncbi:SagB/ThcOx family dehydrogenase [Fredinandcohnia humi]